MCQIPSANIEFERATRLGLEEVENILDLIDDDHRRISSYYGIPQTELINTLHEQRPNHIQNVQRLLEINLGLWTFFGGYNIINNWYSNVWSQENN